MADATITGSLLDAIGDEYDYRRTKMWLVFNTANGRITDANGKVRVGAGQATVNANGTFSLDGVPVPSSSTNPETFQVKVCYDAPPRLPSQRRKDRERGDFGWMTVTTSADIKDLEAEQYAPPEYITSLTEQLDGIVDDASTAMDGKIAEAEAARDLARQYRDQAHDISNIDTTDAAMTAVGADEDSDFAQQQKAQIDDRNADTLPAIYGKKRAEDVRDHGLTGGVDDSAALIAAIAAAGAGGVVELPPNTTIRVRPSTPILLGNGGAGITIRGSALGGSVIYCDRDLTVFKDIAGDGTALRGFELQNPTTGVRANPDIDFVNPYRPVFDDFKLDRSGSATGAAGLVLRKDGSLAGSTLGFMPIFDKFWLRNGWMKIAGVTDGKMSNSFVWGTTTGADGTIQLDNVAGWTFMGTDVIPPSGGDGAGYLFLGGISVNNAIIGGYIDGSYAAIMTGHGIKATATVRALRVIGTAFYNLGKSGLKLAGVSHSTFQGNTFSQCNKADNFYPDVDLTGAIGNTFIGNTHRAPDVRTNLGKVYVEDGTSGDNMYADMSIEIDPSITPNGHYYDTSQFSVVDSALIRTPRPNSRWRFNTAKNPSAPYTVTVYDLFQRRSILVGAGAAVTMPSASSVHMGDFVVIKNTSTSQNVVITPAGSQTIDGAATWTLLPLQSVTLISDSANWVTEGNDSTVLHKAGAETVPGAKTFSGGLTVTGSPLASGNGFRLLDTTRTAAATLTTSSPSNEWCDATTAAFTLTLPATTTAGIEFRIKKIDSSGNAVTVSPGAGGTIDGASTYSLAAQYASVTVVSTGTSGVWRVIAKV